MRFALTPEQRMLAGTVRDLLAAECVAADVRAAWTHPTGRSVKRWARLAELGVTGLTVPEDLGGLGCGEIELAAVLEETGRAALPEPVVENAVAAFLLTAAGDRAWLPRLAAGEAVVTVGLAVPDGRAGAAGGYVADAHVADLLLLQEGDDLHAVPRDAVTVTGQPAADGARRLFSVGWRPAPDTLILPGAGAVLTAAFDRGVLAVSAQLVGLAAAMTATAVEYAKTRTQFGRPIGANQAVKHHLANAHLAVEFARPVVYQAAHALAAGAPAASRDVSAAKCRAAEAADLAARVALQVHGAIGYTRECDLHLWMKRAWALAAAWGDAGWHRARVAAHVLGT